MWAAFAAEILNPARPLHRIAAPPRQEGAFMPEHRPSSFSQVTSLRPARRAVTDVVEPPSRRSRRRVLIGGVLALVVAAVLAIGLYRAERTARAGIEGKAALLRAESNLGARRLDIAREDLQRARSAFVRMRAEIEALGPFGSLARITPFVRVQLRGAEAFSDAGVLLADAGLDLSDTASQLLHPVDPDLPVSAAYDALRSLHGSMGDGVAALDAAIERVASLDGLHLVGRLADARRDLVSRLNDVGPRAAAAEEGLGALLTFLGEAGPRRYLVFSQNPDEVRPTGGFIGTYGVLTAREGTVALDRYDSIESWFLTHPEAVVPPEEASSAFRVLDPPVVQTIANVNNFPDWTLAGELAAELWAKGGEEPVDGAISLTPEFLSRILAVLGPVDVPQYGETINAANVVERTDFYTHRVPVPEADRKDFLAVLADVVMRRVLDAPASSWEELGQAGAAGLDAREAMVWSADDDVATAAARREWDGALPEAEGDFFYEADFEYVAKNGRGLRRTFDHDVEVRPDGSARIITDITIANTEPFDERLNIDSFSYVSVYGPQGAVLDETASDEPVALEAPLSGHPGAGWLIAAEPLSEAALRVVWDVPQLIVPQTDGTWAYRLRWMGLPAHTGDVLNLKVRLPPGWRWRGSAPPERFDLVDEVQGSWVLGP